MTLKDRTLALLDTPEFGTYGVGMSELLDLATIVSGNIITDELVDLEQKNIDKELFKQIKTQLDNLKVRFGALDDSMEKA